MKQQVDGSWKLTAKGRQAYNAITYTPVQQSGSTGAGFLNNTAAKAYSPFRLFMDSLGADKITSKADVQDVIGKNDKISKHHGMWDPNIDSQLGSLFKSSYDGEGRYDAYRSTQYVTPVAGEDRTVETENLRRALSTNGKLIYQPVDWDYEKGWINAGDVIKDEDDIKDYKVTSKSQSLYGTVATLDNGKNVIRVKYPDANINLNKKQNNDTRLRELEIWRQIRDSQYMPEQDPSHPLGIKFDNAGNIKWSKELNSPAVQTDAQRHMTESLYLLQQGL